MKQLLIAFFLLSGVTLGQNITDATKQLKNLPQAVQTQVSTHNLSVPANCVAHSGSATAYTCTTSPTFTPAVGDHIQFEADVANTGTATLAVNGAAAATIHKQGGSATIVANDLLVGHWISATFDGTYWQLEGQLGNAASTSPCTVTGVGSSSTCTFPGSIAVGATNPVTIGGSCPSPTGKVANADGTGCMQIPTGLTVRPFVFPGAWRTTMATGTVISSFIVPTFATTPLTITIPANCNGSQLFAKVAATLSTTVTLSKNGTVICTATVATGGTTATWAGTGATLTSADVLELDGGGDVTFSGISISVAGTLTGGAF